MVEVPAALEEAVVKELGRSDFIIARLAETIPDVVLDNPVEDLAPRVPEDAPGSFFLKMEEIELATDQAMIAVKRGDMASS